mmetsp:Transcript_19433/g.45445  ORF Transcript_19433/g.45445 Transcript_19433/m.45445 type:complete len:311 (+) Transcript_19433:11-943(+)
MAQILAWCGFADRGKEAEKKAEPPEDSSHWCSPSERWPEIFQQFPCAARREAGPSKPATPAATPRTDSSSNAKGGLSTGDNRGQAGKFFLVGKGSDAFCFSRTDSWDEVQTELTMSFGRSATFVYNSGHRPVTVETDADYAVFLDHVHRCSRGSTIEPRIPVDLIEFPKNSIRTQPIEASAPVSTRSYHTGSVPGPGPNQYPYQNQHQQNKYPPATTPVLGLATPGPSQDYAPQDQPARAPQGRRTAALTLGGHGAALAAQPLGQHVDTAFAQQSSSPRSPDKTPRDGRRQAVLSLGGDGATLAAWSAQT